MVYIKSVHKKEDKVIEEQKKSYEVEQIEYLMGSTWWSLVLEYLNKRQEDYKSKIIKQRPAWATETDKIAAYEFMVRTNDIILEIENLKNLPTYIKDDYSNENFTGSVNV